MLERLINLKIQFQNKKNSVLNSVLERLSNLKNSFKKKINSIPIVILVVNVYKKIVDQVIYTHEGINDILDLIELDLKRILTRIAKEYFGFYSWKHLFDPRHWKIENIWDYYDPIVAVVLSVLNDWFELFLLIPGFSWVYRKTLSLIRYIRRKLIALRRWKDKYAMKLDYYWQLIKYFFDQIIMQNIFDSLPIIGGWIFTFLKGITFCLKYPFILLLRVLGYYWLKENIISYVLSRSWYKHVEAFLNWTYFYDKKKLSKEEQEMREIEALVVNWFTFISVVGSIGAYGTLELSDEWKALITIYFLAVVLLRLCWKSIYYNAPFERDDSFKSEDFKRDNDVFK